MQDDWPRVGSSFQHTVQWIPPHSKQRHTGWIWNTCLLIYSYQSRQKPMTLTFPASPLTIPHHFIWQGSTVQWIKNSQHAGRRHQCACSAYQHASRNVLSICAQLGVAKTSSEIWSIMSGRNTGCNSGTYNACNRLPQNLQEAISFLSFRPAVNAEWLPYCWNTLLYTLCRTVVTHLWNTVTNSWRRHVNETGFCTGQVASMHKTSRKMST